MFLSRKFTKEQSKKYALLTSVSVLLIIIFALLMAAWSNNTVTICDGEEIKNVKTQKSDVYSVLEEAGITVSDYDSVEPSLNSRISNNMTINIKRAVKLSVSDEGNKTEYFSSGETVQDVLDQTGYTIGEKDSVAPALDTKAEEGMEIRITRVKKFTVVDGKGERVVESSAYTVNDLLTQLGVNVSDTVDVNLDGTVKLKEGMKIKISDVKVEYEEVTESIPYTIETRNSSSVEKGTTRVAREGVNGVKVVTYAIKYKDGAEVDREPVNTVVKKEAVNKIVEKGTKEKTVTKKKTSSATTPKNTTPVQTSGKKDFSYSNVITCSASAYDLSYESCGKNPGDPYYGITASGMRAQYGVVAVDPRVIPLGTRLYIEAVDGSWTYGYCVAGDTGSGIKGNRVDLFYNSRAEALNFGRRQARVYILN